MDEDDNGKLDFARVFSVIPWAGLTFKLPVFRLWYAYCKYLELIRAAVFE